MAEWVISLLTIIFTPLLTLLGIIVTEKYRYKGKIVETQSDALEKCQARHNGDISKVQTDFNERLDDLVTKLDEIRREQFRTSLTITQLQSDVQKHNNVIERTYKLEQDVAVLKNRESVSEHRIEDLEKHE